MGDRLPTEEDADMWIEGQGMISGGQSDHADAPQGSANDMTNASSSSTRQPRICKMVEQEIKATYENHGYVPEILCDEENLQKARSIYQEKYPEKYASESTNKKPGPMEEQTKVLYGNDIKNMHKEAIKSASKRPADSNQQAVFEKVDEEIQMSNPDSTSKEEILEKSASQEHQEDIWGWVVVVAAALLSMTGNSMHRCFAIIFDKILDDSDSSSSTIAIVVNLYGFIVHASGLPTGVLVRTFGFRRVTFAASCILFFALIASSFVKEVYYLLVSYSIIAGVSCGAFFTIGLTIVPYHFNKNKGRAFALFSLLSFGGSAVLPNAIKLLQENYGHQGAMLILSGFFLNCCVAAVLFRPTANHPTMKLKKSNACDCTESNICNKELDAESKEKNITKDKRRSSNILGNLLKSIVADFRLLRSARAIIISFALPLFICSYYNFSSFLPLIVQEYGFSLKDAADCTSVTLICETIARFAVSVLSDYAWFSYKVNIIVSHLLLIVSMIGISIFQDIYCLKVFSAMFGTGLGATMGVYSLVMVHYMGIDNLSSVLGVTMLILAFCFILLGPLAGLVLDLGLGILGYASFFSFLIIISLVLWQLMPVAIRYDQRKDQANREGR